MRSLGCQVYCRVQRLGFRLGLGEGPKATPQGSCSSSTKKIGTHCDRDPGIWIRKEQLCLAKRFATFNPLRFKIAGIFS